MHHIMAGNLFIAYFLILFWKIGLLLNQMSCFHEMSYEDEGSFITEDQFVLNINVTGDNIINVHFNSSLYSITV